MSLLPRLQLKQPTGWFAAGREIAEALTLLPDPAFRLYLYICLNADRHTGRLVIDPAGPASLKDMTQLLRLADTGERVPDVSGSPGKMGEGGF